MTLPSTSPGERPAEEPATPASSLVWWDWDLASNTVVVHGGPSGSLGFPPCELPMTGKGWDAYAHPDDLPQLRSTLRSFLEGGGDDWRCELRLLQAGGGWHWVLNTGRATERGADGRPTRLQGVSFDLMANRVQHEIILRNAQMLANVRQSMVCTDLRGIVTFWSDGAAELYGWTAAEMLGKPFYERMPTEEMKARARFRMNTAAAKGEFREEREDFRKDGTRIYVDSRVFALRNAAGDVVGVIGTAHDITARRQAESNRLQLERQLLHVQRMDTIGTLAGGVAHEFNNILAAVMGNVELCMLMNPENEQVREHLGWALQSARQGRDLVRRILSFSSGHPSERQVKSMGELLSEAAPLIRASLPSTVELRFESAPGATTARIDPNQVHQVLMNLAANAAHAMNEDGGQLSFNVRCEDFAAPHTCALGAVLPAGPYIAVDVTDTGKGIAEGHLSKIFNPFFTTKPAGKGSGLGLAIVYRILTDHCGGVDVSSRPGSGTRFTLYFPAEAAADEAPPKERLSLGNAALQIGRGESVVVIDDEANVAVVVASALKRMGFNVRRFSAADQFYEEFKARPFQVDLLITDQTMPGLTGLNLGRRLRAEGYDFPIAIASGHSEELTDEAMKELRPSRFLNKPFDIRDLAATVQGLLAPAWTGAVVEDGPRA